MLQTVHKVLPQSPPYRLYRCPEAGCSDIQIVAIGTQQMNSSITEHPHGLSPLCPPQEEVSVRLKQDVLFQKLFQNLFPLHGEIPLNMGQDDLNKGMFI